MKNYKPQLLQKCSTCEHCFILRDFDDPNGYYCNYNDSRPPCGSVLMDEYYNWSTDPIEEISNHIDMEAWWIWSNEFEVSRSGICDYYKKNNKKEETK